MNCKICGSETRELLDKQFNHIYHVCDSCGFVQQNQDHFLNNEEELEEYNRHENTIENVGYVNMFKTFIEESLIPFRTSGSVLDFGSGPEPVFSKVLASYGFDVSIYDLYYANRPEVFDETYDVITSTEVFEHLFEPYMEIKRLVQSLKPGGHLVVMTRFFPKDEELFQNWWYRRDPTHVSFFTVKTFEVIAKDLGLKVIYTNDKNYITLLKDN